MIYVVTGWPRSGTSAMMQALKAGGIAPQFHPAREALMQKRRPCGEYLELKVEQMADAQYLRRELRDGMAVKLPTPYLRNLPPMQCRMIWMHRDPTDIMASLRRMYPDENFEKVYPGWPDGYHETTKAMRELMEDRRSVTISDARYDDLIAAPITTLAGLMLPVNVKAAAAAIHTFSEVA